MLWGLVELFNKRGGRSVALKSWGAQGAEGDDH